MERSAYLRVLTRKPLSSREEGALFLETLEDAGPAFVPERCGSFEPIRQTYDRRRALDQWGHLFFWKRRKPRLDGSLSAMLGPREIHGSIALKMQIESRDALALVGLLETLVLRFEADLAVLHCLTPEDERRGIASGAVVPQGGGKHFFGLHTHSLKRYLPDVYWATVFGPSYIAHFGREGLLSAPAARAVQLSESAIILQMTGELLDCRHHPESVDRTRARVREHLDLNSFFDPEAEEGHVYSVPEFRLPVAGDQGTGPDLPGAPAQRVEYADDALEGLAEMFSSDRVTATFGREELNADALDYSLASLEEVDAYLAAIAQAEGVNAAWDLVVLRCGAYVGEVIRRNAPRDSHWLDYENALKLDRGSFQGFGRVIGTSAVLYAAPDFWCFPLARVEKRLKEGSSESVLQFGQAVVAQLRAG